jgi:TPR repeat protein
MVSSGGKCTAAGNVTTYTCDPGDLAACTAQCDKGDAASCFNAAYMYDTGKGADHDDDKANALYDKACSADFPRACAQLAQYWGNLEGQVIGLARDLEKARTYATKACDQGQPEACSELGLIAEGDLSIPDSGPKPDYPKAIAYYLRGCQGGDPMGCKYAGDAFRHDGDGVKPDWAKSVDNNQRSCDGGVVEGCIQAVGDLLEGDRVSADPRRATTLLRRLCDKYPEHCSYLGIAAMRGLAGWRDDAAATAAFSRGCAGGETLSCALEAQMRLDGRGVSADEDNAFATLKSICDGLGGDGMDPAYGAACGGVAHAIQLGKGTKKDPRAAYKQFADLCSGAFDHVSCTEQALALRDGIGVRANRAAMKPLLVKACSYDFRWNDRDPRACHEQGGIAPATGAGVQEGD